MEDQGLNVTKRDEKIALVSGYTNEEVAIIKATVAKGASDTELAFFLNVCKSVELNPFNKEIWCYKDSKNNLLVFAGRDGFLSKAQKNPVFNGIRSSEVREKDVWALDIANGTVKHEISLPQSQRGQIIGAYAIVFRKGGEPTIEWAEFTSYNKGHNTWNTHPQEMIKKVAESHALKKAFGISGIQSEFDFDIKENIAVPMNTQLPKTKEQRLWKELIDALDLSSRPDKEDLKQMAIEKKQNGDLTEQFIVNLILELNGSGN